jgi:hypothetical protein
MRASSVIVCVLAALVGGCSSAKVIEPSELTPEEERRLEQSIKDAAAKEGQFQDSGKE